MEPIGPMKTNPTPTPLYNRRQVLWTGAGLGASFALASGLPSCASAGSAPKSPLFRISLAEWSLHRELQSGRLDNLQFAEVARQEFGLAAVEYVNTFFKDKAGDVTYLRELKQRADDQDVRSLLIMIDGEGQLGDDSDVVRRESVLNHYKWIDAGHRLGCHSIRVNAGGPGTPEELRARVADSLHTLGDYADERGMHVIVENHGGLSSNGKWLAGTIAAANHPRVGTLPDFGNFSLGNGEWYDRYQGVREMMPFAQAVSAKSHEFDAAGDETGTDYRRMLRIVLDAGYHGHLGIEYEGSDSDERAGIRKTLVLLERVRDELAAERS